MPSGIQESLQYITGNVVPYTDLSKYRETLNISEERVYLSLEKHPGIAQEGMLAFDMEKVDKLSEGNFSVKEITSEIVTIDS